MGKYEPPFTITNKILSHVSSISEKIGQITAIRKMEAKPHLRRNIRIQSIHFDATEQLENFIQKKIEKLNRYCDDILAAEVTLKVLKPETSQNKEAGIKLLVPRAEDIFSSKIADTFEEAVDLALDALVRQLQKNKEKTRAK